VCYNSTTLRNTGTVNKEAVTVGSNRFFMQGALAVVLVSLALGSLTGCSSTVSAVGRLLDEATDAIVGETAPEKTGGGDPTEGQSVTGTQGLFGELAALENVMLFNVAYLQVIFLGGPDPAFDDFREGEGVTWEITGGDENDDSSFIAERALLKRHSDGTSWWYLGYDAEEDTLEYEVLMDDEYVPIEIVWRDGDSGQTMRYTFDYGEEDAPPPTEEDAVVYSDEIPDENSLGRERITVGSGTYTAEHVAYGFNDAESDARLEYHWWLVDDVPGDLVKYEYRQFDGGEESMISGELVATDDGYVTRLGAY